MRTISTPTLMQASAGAANVGWLLEIDWPTPVYLSSFGPLSWNGQSWIGAALQLGDFSGESKPSRVSIVDSDAAYRTLILIYGLRDARVKIWKVYTAALATGDPIAVFSGYGDGVEIANGVVAFTLDWNTTRQQFSPRERIGPSIGVNFVATPGQKLTWCGQTITIEAR